MKHKSVLRGLAAAVLTCTFCGSGLTAQTLASEEPQETKLPDRFDLRDEGAVTAVKKQIGSTCHIFSAMAAIESNLIKQGLADNSIDLSEEHYSWFTFVKGEPEDPDDPLRNEMPDGGIEAYEHGSEYLKTIGTLSAWIGVVPASMTPRYWDEVYPEESQRYASTAHLQNAVLYLKIELAEIKENLMKKGAMQLAYFDVKEPQLYSQYGGYYQTLWGYAVKDKVRGQDEVHGALHSVCLIGWDDNFPKEHFVETPPGDGAWLCKNSWGEDSTQTVNSYLYLSYYDPSIHNIIQYEMEPADNYDRNYQYSRSLKGICNLYDRSIRYANVYTAEKDENLTAVSLFMNVQMQPCEIGIYALPDDFANPCDGELLAQITCQSTHDGYFTYPLKTACQVSAGQKFAAVVTTPNVSGVSFRYDTGGNGAGKSFYMLCDQEGNGEWQDAADAGPLRNVGNFFVKVFTKDGTALSERNYPDPRYRQAAAEAYDKNGDCVITDAELAEAEPFLRGDLNRDGQVNGIDLSLLKHVLPGGAYGGLCLLAGDWNGDHVLNDTDAQGLLEFLLSGA